MSQKAIDEIAMNKNGRKKHHSIIMGVVLILLLVNLAVSSFFVVDSVKLNQRLETLENRSQISASSKNYDDEHLLSYYKELSDKADSGIDRVIAFSAIASTLIIAFTVYMSFHVPRQLEKQIEDAKVLADEAKQGAIEALEVKALAKKAKESADNANYLFEIIEAVTDDTNGEPTISYKLSCMTYIIDKYPKKPLAYIYRGVMY
jgi:hypothetical protein